MSIQDMLSERQKLQERLARQEGRIADRSQDIEKLRADVVATFGTSDTDKLREIYIELKRKKEAIANQIQTANLLVDAAVTALEANKPIPGDVLAQIEQFNKVANQSEADAPDVREEKPQQQGDEVSQTFEAHFESGDEPQGELLDEVKPHVEQANPLERTFEKVEQAKQGISKSHNEKQPHEEQLNHGGHTQSFGAGLAL